MPALKRCCVALFFVYTCKGRRGALLLFLTCFLELHCANGCVGTQQKEKVDNLLKLDGLRRANTETMNLFRKMQGMKTRSLGEAEAVEKEKERMAAEITEYRAFLDEQRLVFVGVTESVMRAAASLQLEEEKKEEAIRAKAAGRIDKLKELVREKEIESDQLQQRLEELNKSVKLYESSFKDVCLATGLTDPDQIVTKYFLKEDIRAELEREKAAKTRRLAELQAAYAETATNLQVTRDTFMDNRWRDVALTQDKVREAQMKAEKRAVEIEKNTSKLAFLQEGLVSLARRIDKITV